MIDKILFGDFGNYSPHYLSHFYCVNFMIVLTKKPILAEKEINFGVFFGFIFSFQVSISLTTLKSLGRSVTQLSYTSFLVKRCFSSHFSEQ